MNTVEFEQWVQDTWTQFNAKDQERTLSIVSLGLVGEVSEFITEILVAAEMNRRAGLVAEESKKRIRDREEINRYNLASEAGDILYYLTRLLMMHGLTLQDAVEAVENKVAERYGV